MRIEEELLVLEPSEKEDAFVREDRTYVRVNPEVTQDLETMEQGINYSAAFTEKLIGITKDQLEYRLNKDEKGDLWVSWNSSLKCERYDQTVSEIQDFIMANAEIAQILKETLQEICREGDHSVAEICLLVEEAIDKKKDQFQEILDRQFLNN